MSTRAEHLQWAKARAAKCLGRGDFEGAWSSFCADMMKHDETRGHSALQIGTMLKFTGGLSSVSSIREFIEGFN